MMNTFLFTLILFADFKLSYSQEISNEEPEYPDYGDNEDLGGDKGPREECGYDTAMTSSLRFTVRVQHNQLRINLANGTQKNGLSGRNFPRASDMKVMLYDCNLEKSALEIAQTCHFESHHNFSNVGSNSAIYTGNVNNTESIIEQLITGWWNTSKRNGPLINLTPRQKDSAKIPFLQEDPKTNHKTMNCLSKMIMHIAYDATPSIIRSNLFLLVHFMANANTTKLGCAYNVCDGKDKYGCPISPPFVLFVCQYGDSHINVNTPIYKEGSPCSSCNTSCAGSYLCNTTRDTEHPFTTHLPKC
ncbi:hypothetical protein KIN20_007711 [Parelaphostrongylus tenuis]|uniref:SCP domain-containing protein n=1 Tax=Parelaphostrongylus tenuis TaxID=148309 RepID=A0AAD5M6X6_PARTN|nr:hypothetical protein KIN20_007711 [Parelaphostrongylus tenuis]